MSRVNLRHRAMRKPYFPRRKNCKRST